MLGLIGRDFTRPDLASDRRPGAAPGYGVATGSEPRDAVTLRDRRCRVAIAPSRRDACESGPGPPPARPRPLLAHLGPDCPTRPVDWRWLKAGLMLDLGLRWSRRRDDGPTREARRYRAAWRRCRDDAGRERLRRQDARGRRGVRDPGRRAPGAVGRRGPPAGRRGDRRRGPQGRPEARGRRLVRDVVLPHHRPARQPGLPRPRGDRAPPASGPAWRRISTSCGSSSPSPGGRRSSTRSSGPPGTPPGGPRRPGEALPEVAPLPGPMGLAIAATTLPEGLGGRSGSKALLRLAASERRYAERAREATALMPGLPVTSAGARIRP